MILAVERNVKQQIKKISWTYKYFMGSLLSTPLHRLEQISFSAHLATSVVVATLFCFFGLVNIFVGSLLSIPLHRLELISFLSKPGKKCCHGNTFFFSFDLQIFLWVLCFPYPAQIGAD